MGTSLTGSTPGSTYGGLVKTSDNAAIGLALKTLSDGLGNDSALQVASWGIKSTGTLTVDGTSTLTGAVSAPAGVTGPHTGAHNGTVGATTPNTGAFTTLTASGAATFNGAINANAGVQFPATQAASSDPNQLDDYEEGNWTPALNGSATYTAQTGRYTKIGRMVYITGTIVVNFIGTSDGYTITGLPFAASSAFYEWPGSVSTWTSAAGNFVFVGFRVLGGGTTGEMTGAALAQNSCNTAIPVFTSGTYVYFSAAYSV